MKKARAWLAAQAIEYAFHDYKKAGIDPALLQHWVSQVGWEPLLNRRGMMWRKVPTAVKGNIDESSAMQLMLATPSIIKRPVLAIDNQLYIGFQTDTYEKIFSL